jgi:hypothetical protein
LLDQLVDLSVLRGQARHNKLESRPQTSLPASWEEFGAYNRSMWDSETLTVTPEARAIAEQVLKGTKLWLRAPKWYGAVTAGMLPHQLRKAFSRRLSAGPGRAVRRLSNLRPRPLRNLGSLAPRPDYQSRPARLGAVVRIRRLAARPHRLCQSALNFDPRSARNSDPCVRRDLAE